ncbi:Scr1 family TA system antitoxin-like transcriptional regulator [Micromonospora rifamycinica]|uniref:Scr1 family TA system antitoxin-like transcriptional regulator n=1 Tax=Micromonospora rifamycinica TaxID=291594 RepID=UPI00340F83F1
MALRRIRDDRKLTLDEVRKKMDWSLSKLVRIEAGAVSISQNDLKALLQLYGVNDPAEREELLDLARRSRQHHWAGEYRDITTPSYMEFLGYEDDAVRITQYSPIVIPGLLQNQEYASEIIKKTAVDDDDATINRLALLRKARQDRFFSASRASHGRFIIPDTVLAELTGTESAARQRVHLVELAANPRVHLFVLNTAKAPKRILASLSLHEFQSEVDPDIVYISGIPDLDGALVEGGRVNRYKSIIDKLLAHCHDEDASLSILRERGT